MHRRAILLLVAAAFVATAGPAFAQDIQNFRPAVGTWNYFSVEGARTAEHGELVPSLYINYGHNPLVERRKSDDEIVRRLVSSLATANAMAVIGLWNRLELGVDVPVNYVAGDAVNNGASLGDIRFLPKLRLFGLGTGEKRGVGLAIAVPLGLPTGSDKVYVGENQVTVNPKLILEARMAGFSFAANGGLRVRPSNNHVASLDLGNEVTYGAGAGVDLGGEDVVLLGEIFGAAPIENVSGDSRSNPLEALLGVRLFTKVGAVLTLGAGTGLIPDYGSPQYRLLAGFAWHVRERDRDGDGFLDEVDKCPDDPEDKDGFEDQDGCPDLDNDQDGVLDVVDQCPLDPEDVDGFQDQNGCPDPDNDQDGILDRDDKCPDEPETVNDYQDADGCPDEIGDRDGDGLLDPNDKCPDDPEDKDEFEDEDGCPDPDNDQDGILDVDDQCQNDPEVVNGFEDDDGCPDESPKIRITAEKIEIMEKVYFETGKAVIKPVSYDILDQVIVVLKGNPQLARVRVEGHTDSQGKTSYNEKLSQQRAESVREYLVRGGAAAERLEAVGYGESTPIDTNKTREGRSRNRRVEFTILQTR